MNSRLNTIRAFAVILAFGPLAANAAPTYWATNGHYYEVIAGNGMTWDAARTAAALRTHFGVNGHLATLTTAEEDEFVDQLRLAALTGVLTQGQVWIGGLQADSSTEPGEGWGWINGEGSIPGTDSVSPYANWAVAKGEPNNSGGPSINERHLALGRYTDDDGWNDEGSAPASIGGYVVEFDLTSEAVVVPGFNELIFNQANVPGSDNPLTASAQEVLPGGGGPVSISCCRVLDTREGAGPAKHGYFLRQNLDLGDAVADLEMNPSCDGMPAIAAGTAIMPPWLRGVPTSRGIDDPGNSLVARPNDLGVCAIEADILMKGVVFSEEDARNVLGYSVNCAEPNISYRPFAGGVTTSSPTEVDAPHVTTWTAECDETRSAKKYSDNVMVLNLRHDVQINPKLTYLVGLKLRTWQSIYQARAEGCVDNSTGFLNQLLNLTARAGADILLQRGEAAVQKLDDATRLALLIPTIPPGTPLVGDPYGEGEELCPGNPKGLFVGRLMALKFATCSELVQAGSGENSQAPAACAIAGDILDALPPLPTL